MGKSFRDLIVWQRSVDMTVSVYELTENFPRKEIYGLTSQLRRAAVSVASNIAEGAGRGSKKEFRQFLNMARGSNCEVQTQLVIATRLDLADRKQILTAESLSHEVGRMLNGLLQSLLREQPGTNN
jgi:four helix bundle protein